MKLLVRNLATATTEEKLLSLFKEYGQVQSCSLVLDAKTGKSKGFGFIEMPKVGEAKVAIKNLNGYKLAGNLIRVKKAEAKKTDAEPKQAEVKPAPAKAAKEDKKEKAEIELPKELKGNKDNALNIYGTVKSED